MRKHARFRTDTQKAAARVILGEVTYSTVDWGLGGFRLGDFGGDLTPGEVTEIRFVVGFQGLEVSFLTHAEVLRIDPSTHSLSAQFVELGTSNREFLKEVIDGLESGDMFTAGGTIVNLRPPVTRPSGDPPVEESPSGPFRHVTRRRVARASLFLILGLVLVGYLGVAAYHHYFRLETENALVSRALVPIVSRADGYLERQYVFEGDVVEVDQPLLLLQDDALQADLDSARQQLAAAENVLTGIRSQAVLADSHLSTYQSLVENRLQAANVAVEALRSEVTISAQRLHRFRTGVEAGLVPRTDLEREEAQLLNLRGRLDEASAVQRAEETAADALTHGSFYDGQRLISEVPHLGVASAEAEQGVHLARAALRLVEERQHRLTYRAPFSGRVVRVAKPQGVTVARGEPLVLLEPRESEPIVEAYYPHDKVVYARIGSSASILVPALDRRYEATIVDVARGSGRIGDQQTLYDWRPVPDGTARVRLAFSDLGPAGAEELSTGMPATVNIARRPAFGMEASSRESPRREEPVVATPSRVNAGLERGLQLALNGTWTPVTVLEQLRDAAERALQADPAPVESLRSAGMVDLNAVEVKATRRGFQDADHFLTLALAYRYFGDTRYLRRASLILASWAETNRPTGHPIDESRLDGFLVGYDLLASSLQRDDRDAALEWFRRLAQAKREWVFGPRTRVNNHQTHHLKLLLMLDAILADSDSFDADLQTVRAHAQINLDHSSGEFPDFRERDSLFYHIYNLEAWIEIGLLSGCCSEQIDDAFDFAVPFLLGQESHAEFVKTRNPLDGLRGQAGDPRYAPGNPYDPERAAKAILSYYTLRPERADSRLLAIATAVAERDRALIFEEARYYLWM